MKTPFLLIASLAVSAPVPARAQQKPFDEILCAKHYTPPMNCGAASLRIDTGVLLTGIRRGISIHYYESTLSFSCRVGQEGARREQAFVFACEFVTPLDGRTVAHGESNLDSCVLTSPAPSAEETVHINGFFHAEPAEVGGSKLAWRFNSTGANPFFKPGGSFGFTSPSTSRMYFTDCSVR
ncbi:MAG: hypothetical protein HY059_22935 [Proteobacteria bacterium]|nr:hypothetical protein [Pseudomonadota bacterium]